MYCRYHCLWVACYHNGCRGHGCNRNKHGYLCCNMLMWYWGCIEVTRHFRDFVRFESDAFFSARRGSRSVFTWLSFATIAVATTTATTATTLFALLCIFFQSWLSILHWC